MVALNAAILHHATPADVWLGVDSPLPGRDRGFLALAPGGEPAQPWPPWAPGRPPLAVTKSCCDGWDQALEGPLAALRGRLAKIPVAMELQAELLGWRSDLCWTEWSITAALFWATIHGARRVRFLGVDLAGTEFAYGIPGLLGAREPGERWRRERQKLNQARAEVKERGGVETEIVSPLATMLGG